LRKSVRRSPAPRHGSVPWVIASVKMIAVPAGPVTGRTRPSPDQIRVVVVEPVARSEEFVEVRQDRLMVDERSDGGSPVEDVAEAVGRRICRHVARDALVHERVDRCEGRRRQGLGDRQIPVQVEEVALGRVHRQLPTIRIRARCPCVANALSPGMTPVTTSRTTSPPDRDSRT
jgi:hypothetical protein